MRRALRFAGRYWYHGLALFSVGTALLDVTTGHPLSTDNQVFYIATLGVWILLHAGMRHLYEQRKELSDQWEMNAVNWKKLYEMAMQRRRSIWS